LSAPGGARDRSPYPDPALPTQSQPEPALAWTPPPWRPFEASFEGFTGSPEDWGNTVAVGVADRVGRQLIRIDTNYKPTRRSDHPVDLTRTDTVRLAVALLRAAEDTFQHGRLRPTEAAELLGELGELDYALAELRAHALGDLLHAGIMNGDGQRADLLDAEVEEMGGTR